MSLAFLVENKAERRRGKKRMVVNYKAINKATIGDTHNLPNKDTLLSLIRGKNLFSSFDSKSGFWQVLLDKEAQLLTAFTCPQGHFQWTIVPFRLKQAPVIFQRHMQNTFGLFEKFCCVYVDDILVFSDNEQDHLLHVMLILQKCKQLGVVLSKKKAQLFKESINFLGLEMDKGTHHPQSHIIKHIKDFPNKLKYKKQLQRFLRILTYASDYILKLVTLRAPFQCKLKKDVLWTWDINDTDRMIKESLSGGKSPLRRDKTRTNSSKIRTEKEESPCHMTKASQIQEQDSHKAESLISDGLTTSPKMVINSPCLTSKKELTIPEQTTTSKESTNSLIADSLLKTITPTKLVRPQDFNKRPNMGIQTLEKTMDQTLVSKQFDSGIQTPNTAEKPYYVVFNAPYAGIYEEWQHCKAAILQVLGVQYKRYPSFGESKAAAAVWAEENYAPYISFIPKKEMLRLDTYFSVLTSKKKASLPSLGSLPSRRKRKR
nr:retrotransposon protein, putative, Ty3-gypsy subclass [Tanacetum cinerariifolium]